MCIPCPYCEHPVPFTATVCYSCGKDLNAAFTENKEFFKVLFYCVTAFVLLLLSVVYKYT